MSVSLFCTVEWGASEGKTAKCVGYNKKYRFNCYTAIPITHLSWWLVIFWTAMALCYSILGEWTTLLARSDVRTSTFDS